MSARNFAVLGSPISHSLSPKIHMMILKHLGMNDNYQAIDVSDLSAFLDSNRDFTGLSLTMPLKEQALAFADSVEPVAKLVGSVNTLHHKDGIWLGYNTDIYGLRKAVSNTHFKTVAVIGTGATARSALQAFQGTDLQLWGRNSATAQELSERFGATSVEAEKAFSADLVISTLPTGALAEVLERNGAHPGTLLDVAYGNDLQAPIGSFANRISGLEMLLWQAIAQQRIFSGSDVNTELPDEGKLADDIRQALGMPK